MRVNLWDVCKFMDCGIRAFCWTLAIEGFKLKKATSLKASVAYQFFFKVNSKQKVRIL